MGTLCCWCLWILALFGTVVMTIYCIDLEALVYQGCSQEQYENGSDFEGNLNTMFESFLSKGDSVLYFNASVGDRDDTVYGLFQCRGDLSNADCSNCVKNVVGQASVLCGRSRGARIHLEGCYLRYDNSMFFGEPDTELVYKTCSPEISTDVGFYFRRNNVFDSLVTGSYAGNDFRVTTSGDSNTGLVYGLAQCEEDLSSPDCANCVLTAVQNLKDLCGSSVAGQVYLQKCHVSYAKDRTSYSRQDDSNHVTAKTVAIVIGSLAAVAFAVVLIVFLKSLYKKHG
eukprot:Gb_15963 [translate_table: standard]